ncbi:MAG: SLBB domain-containing protein, partial [Gammaproteobacteria bacterium]|nr:SLBB domain-containing protein [Gammaproteobacteria bacterium]
RPAEEIQKEITQRLKKYIPEPVVTVVVEKVASYKIYVIGEVKNSGQYQVGHYLDVVQALALAGGLTAYAAENKIKILRRENGAEIAIPFEYAKVKSGADLKQNIILRRGDVVVVP